MMFVVKKTFMASASFPCLQWEMASNQTETILGLDQSPGHLLDCSVLKGIGKAGVVKYYYSALYLESYIFQLFFFFHTQRARMKEIFHIFHLHLEKRKEKMTTYMKEKIDKKTVGPFSFTPVTTHWFHRSQN